MKPIIPGIILLALPATAFGGGSAVTLTQSWSGTLAIPDNSGVGASNTITITAPVLDRIEFVTVAIELEGGWNGDFYAYLVHDGTLAILLNRPGRTAFDDLGSGSTNLIALFDDLAAGDVHMLLPGSGNATGTWQPDGRMIDPLLSLDTTARTEMLDGFTNANPNGDWTLFIADQNPGDTATLKSWTLSVTAVPEASTAVFAALAAGCFLRRRRSW